MDNAIGFPNTYPLDSDLSGGECYPTFEQLGRAWENMFKHQFISFLVISSFILMTCMLDQAVLLSGEIRCWSLLGLKGPLKYLVAMIRGCHARAILLPVVRKCFARFLASRRRPVAGSSRR